MHDVTALFAVVAVSAVPALAVLIWFRIARYPFPPHVFSVFFLAGATSLFAALFLQGFIAGTGILPDLSADRTSLFAKTFAGIALPEELSRLLLIAPALAVLRRLKPPGTFPQNLDPDTTGRSAGLVAGLGFGVFESAVYGSSYPANILLRIFTAIPLHAACGCRVGSAVTVFRQKPALAVFRFLSAAAIHGIYNLLIASPGFPAVFLAVFVVLSASASSVLAISRGMAEKDGEAEDKHTA